MKISVLIRRAVEATSLKMDESTRLSDYALNVRWLQKGVCAHVKQQVRQVAVRVEMCTCEVLHLRKCCKGSTGRAAAW